MGIKHSLKIMLYSAYIMCVIPARARARGVYVCVWRNKLYLWQILSHRTVNGFLLNSWVICHICPDDKNYLLFSFHMFLFWYPSIDVFHYFVFEYIISSQLLYSILNRIVSIVAVLTDAFRAIVWYLKLYHCNFLLA